MSDDALESVLRLVAEGRLTAEEAGPILDGLAKRAAAGDARPLAVIPGPTPPPGPKPASTGSGRVIRLEVNEGGRPVVNLRIPLSLGKAALGQIPGLSESTTQRIREALDAGVTGPILDVAEGSGDTVRVLIE